jgi:hypothetical protein
MTTPYATREPDDAARTDASDGFDGTEDLGERAAEHATELYAATEHERRRERFDLIIERAATQP